MEDANAAAGVITKVVAVSVLTRLDKSALEAAGVSAAPQEPVERLALLAKEAGLDGIVCSGAEVAHARKIWPGGYFVVPGVRPAGNDKGDQKRAVTPREALDAGASMLVIGRAITNAREPGVAAREIGATL